MKKLLSHIKHPRSISIIIFLVSFGLSLFLVYSRYQLEKDGDNDLMNNQLNQSKDRLDQTFSYNLSAARSLALMIEEIGNSKKFDSVASLIFNSNKSLDGLVITNGVVISEIHPHTLNQIEIESDILKIISNLNLNNKTVIYQDSFILGRDNSNGGEKYLISGHPIFRDNEKEGYAIVIVKFNTLIKSIGIDTSEFQCQLNKITDDGKSEINVYPEHPKFDIKKAAFTTLRESGWKLYLNKKPEGVPANLIILFLFSTLISLLFGLQAYKMMRQPHKLKQLVDAKSLELYLSQHKYKSTLDRITDGFASLDMSWNFTYINKTASNLLNREPDSLIGKNFHDEFPNSVGKNFYQACERAKKEQKYMFHLEHIEEFDFYIEHHIYPSPEGLSIFLKDITAQKRIAIEEEINERRFKALVENNDGIISVADELITA